MDYSAVSAKSEKDVPEWAKRYHEWEATTDVSNLKKLEVKMNLCCRSCEEKIGDKIRGMPGVFDFKTDRINDLLTICESSGEGPNHEQLLKKLKKVDKRAQIVTKPDNSKPVKKVDKPAQIVTKPDNSKPEREEEKIVYVAVPVLAPWIPGLGMSILPPFVNYYNYWQHRVSCGHCLCYPDVVCSNCGRGSELGALSGKESS